jgi:hypothetical protein
MNVLLLTPDAVGSTLLQRLITVYMQFHEFNQPVINLHELTNGLEKYYSPDFNREILGKPNRVNKEWGYYQTLEEIVGLLSSVDHYKTARLAEYHIKGRRDSISQQIPFYQYLDENFFIISCRRRNLFEHALSWGLNKITKKLNVYSATEKINSFYDLYKNQVNIDAEGFKNSLFRYQSYLKWCDDHFNVGSYFYYEDNINDLENYILDLPIFSNQSKKISWHDTYNIDFKSWNQTHYYLSNIGSLALSSTEKMLSIKDSTQATQESRSEYSLLTSDQKNLLANLSSEQQQHVKTHLPRYQDAQESMMHMQRLGILVSSVPIKKQTLAEKKFIIKNFNQCLDIFNDWAINNPGIAEVIDPDDIEQHIEKDLIAWKSGTTNDQPTASQLYLPPTD